MIARLDLQKHVHNYIQHLPPTMMYLESINKLFIYYAPTGGLLADLSTFKVSTIPLPYPQPFPFL
jgi:hypothetical protein